MDSTPLSGQRSSTRTRSEGGHDGANSLVEPRTFFYTINERPVDDISLEFFYKPHTLTVLLVSIVAVIYYAFTRDSDVSREKNIWAGLCCMVFFFLIVSSLAFPNGPFTRPHPVIWRVVFGMSVLYLMLLLFILFQKYQDVKSIVYWFYSDLESFRIDSEKVLDMCAC